ncbi:MAG: PAS domain S-box protein, partial [Acidobacteriota bacterium]
MKALVVLADASRQREIADFFSRRLHADVHGGCDTAIDAAAREHFPYVILDAAVPGALDVCRTIRRRPDGDCSYVIAVLSDGTAANLREAMEAGVDDYVSPPLDIGSLQMRMAIAERNLARRLRSPQSAGDGLADRRYRTLVQSMHEGVFLVDERGRIEFANTRMSSLSGYSIDELVGQSADELLVDDDFRARLPGQTLLGSGIGSEEYTLPLRRKDGGHAWVQLVGAPTQTADGRHGSMGIVRDLTEQRKAEEGLKYREEYFRALLDSSTDLISIIGIDGQILYQSPSSERMLGLPPELLTGTDVLDFIHSDDRQAFSAALDAAIAGAEPTTAEMRLRRSGGEWLYVESLCANLVDNPVIGGIVVTSRDITERRRVEAALKRERAFFQQLFDKSPAGIVVLNTQDRVVDANRSFVDLFQFEVDDLAGRRLGTRIVPEDRQNEAQDLSQAVAAGQNVVHETVRKRKDGTDVDVSIVCYPVDVAGRRVGAFGLYTDITERKKAERQLFHEAFHDALTGLPNRSLLSERLERCVKRAKRRDDYQFALLFIDLDGFKGINDTFGHQAGDQVLIEVGR